MRPENRQVHERRDVDTSVGQCRFVPADPQMTTDKVLAALQGVGGTVQRTSFDHTKEQALRDALAAHAGLNPPVRRGNAPPTADCRAALSPLPDRRCRTPR